jgi:DNA processing protein
LARCSKPAASPASRCGASSRYSASTPESTPRTRAGDEFDDAGGAAYRTGDDAEAARERIIALLGPSPITLDELGRAAEAPARAVRVALLELELAGRIEFSGDRVALRATADER